MLGTAPGGRPFLRLPPASDRINQTRPDGSHALSGRVLLCSVPLRLREDAVPALVSLQRAWSLPLFGEGGRAQRGRMRSFPLCHSASARSRRDPWGWSNLPFPTRAAFGACSETPAASLGVARTCRSHCRLLRSCSGTRFFFSFFVISFCCAWAAAQTCAGANAAPAPAQGVSPLDPFPLARSLGVGFICCTFQTSS